jgi:hypothetical protein
MGIKMMIDDLEMIDSDRSEAIREQTWTAAWYASKMWLTESQPLYIKCTSSDIL